MDSTGTPQKSSTPDSTNRLSWKELEQRYVGRKFVRRKDGKQETWLITDCTLGGDIWIRYGRSHYSQQVPQEAFLEWVRDAKEVAKQ